MAMRVSEGLAAPLSIAPNRAVRRSRVRVLRVSEANFGREQISEQEKNPEPPEEPVTCVYAVRTAAL
jgi:hypothetical protein